ncbi:MAG: ACT domain-containing protein [Nanoarchaeota archaeon]|nr:ACT domain-containing protein [Nanoarchaeota archaeon]
MAIFISQDDDEITIITEEKNLINTKYEKEVKWFKLFEFKVSIPFLAPGFLAKISKTIADKNLNIVIVSTFSKDYVLIKEIDFEIAIKALEDMGFSIKVE